MVPIISPPSEASTGAIASPSSSSYGKLRAETQQRRLQLSPVVLASLRCSSGGDGTTLKSSSSSPCMPTTSQSTSPSNTTSGTMIAEELPESPQGPALTSIPRPSPSSHARSHSSPQLLPPVGGRLGTGKHSARHRGTSGKALARLLDASLPRLGPPAGLAGGEGVRQLREILAKNLARATTLFQLLDVECATLQLEPTLATSSSLPTGVRVLSALLLTACLWARAPFAAAERVTLTGTRWLR